LLYFKVLYCRIALGTAGSTLLVGAGTSNLLGVLYPLVLKLSAAGQPWELPGVPFLSIEHSRFVVASAEEAYDKTWVPLLDQCIVEALGLFALLTFVVKDKAR